MKALVVAVLAASTSVAMAQPTESAPKAKTHAKAKAAKAAKAAKTAKAKKPDKKKAPPPEDEGIDIDLDAAGTVQAAPPPPPAAEPEAHPLDEPASPHVDADGDASVSVSVSRDSHGPKTWHLAAGVAYLDPLSTSQPLTLSNVSGPASLAIQNGPIAGSGASVGSATIPALIVGVDLPYLHHKLSLETVLGMPFTVKFQATGTLATMSLAPSALGIPTGVPPLGSELGEAKAAPPLVTLVYSPLRGAALQPYVGAGVAVLFAYDEKVTNPILTQVSQPDMHISPAPGLVLQAGLTAPITAGFYARLDLKFIAGLEANAEVDHIRVATPDLPLFGNVEVGTAKMSVTVNPLIVQAGIGRDF